MTRAPQPPPVEGQVYVFDSFPWLFVSRMTARGASWCWREIRGRFLVRIDSPPTAPVDVFVERIPIVPEEEVETAAPERRLVLRRMIPFDLLAMIPPTVAKELEPTIKAYVEKKRLLEEAGCVLYNNCQTAHKGFTVPIEKCVCDCDGPCDFDPHVVMGQEGNVNHFDDFMKWLRTIGLIYEHTRAAGGW